MSAANVTYTDLWFALREDLHKSPLASTMQKSNDDLVIYFTEFDIASLQAVAERLGKAQIISQLILDNKTKIKTKKDIRNVYAQALTPFIKNVYLKHLDEGKSKSTRKVDISDQLSTLLGLVSISDDNDMLSAKVLASKKASTSGTTIPTPAISLDNIRKSSKTRGRVDEATAESGLDSTSPAAKKQDHIGSR